MTPPNTSPRRSVAERCQSLLSVAPGIADLAAEVESDLDAVRSAELRLVEDLGHALADCFEVLPLAEFTVDVAEWAPETTSFFGLFKKMPSFTVRGGRCRVLVARGRVVQDRNTAGVAVDESGRLFFYTTGDIEDLLPGARIRIAPGSVAEVLGNDGSPAELSRAMTTRRGKVHDWTLDTAKKLGIEPQDILAAAEQALQAIPAKIAATHTDIERRRARLA